MLKFLEQMYGTILPVGQPQPPTEGSTRLSDQQVREKHAYIFRFSLLRSWGADHAEADRLALRSARKAIAFSASLDWSFAEPSALAGVAA